jgi:hypothetical protein
VKEFSRPFPSRLSNFDTIKTERINLHLSRTAAASASRGKFFKGPARGRRRWEKISAPGVGKGWVSDRQPKRKGGRDSGGMTPLVVLPSFSLSVHPFHAKGKSTLIRTLDGTAISPRKRKPNIRAALPPPVSHHVGRRRRQSWSRDLSKKICVPMENPLDTDLQPASRNLLDPVDL